MDSYTGEQANLANAIALAIFSFLSFFLAYQPVKHFWERNNVPAISIIAVVTIANEMNFLNAIIWHNEDQSTWWNGHGLCDIEVLLRYPISIALAASLCALSRDVANCLVAKSSGERTREQKRIKFCFDLAFCWGVPVIQMGLHYIVQAGRYEIFPVFGCSDVLDNSWPTLVIIMIWCPIFTGLNMLYAGILLVRLHKSQSQMTKILRSSGSGLRLRQYIKLLTITMTLIVIYCPVQIVLFCEVLPTNLAPYSWSRIHKDFGILFYHTSTAPALQYRGWSNVATSFLLWLFFGFEDKAVDFYRLCLVKLGLARIWPSLKNTRLERQALRRAAGGDPTCFGRACKIINLVNHIIKYFEGIDKSANDDGIQMHTRRRSSLANLVSLNRSASGHSDEQLRQNRNTSVYMAARTSLDAINPVPRAFGDVPRLPSLPMPAITRAYPPRQMGFLFRYNPFDAFRGLASTSTTDLEAQRHTCAECLAASRSATPVAFTTTASVRVNITNLDSNAAKPGSSAHLEREQREKQKLEDAIAASLELVNSLITLGLAPAPPDVAQDKKVNGSDH